MYRYIVSLPAKNGTETKKADFLCYRAAVSRKTDCSYPT